MAISKRLRFEVLRRDRYTCRYCGVKAPDAKIVVDHVVPEALGGLSVPSNLVAACEPCNLGKTSVSPDAHLVADVHEDALRWAQATAAVAADMLAQQEERDADAAAFRERWDEQLAGTNIYLPQGWRSSVDRIMAAGLPLTVLLGCINTAAGARNLRNVDVFRYTCGVAWRKVSALHDAARTAASPGHVASKPSPVEHLAQRVLDRICHPDDRDRYLDDHADHSDTCRQPLHQDDESEPCAGRCGGGQNASAVAAAVAALEDFPPDWFDLTEIIRDLIAFSPERTAMEQARDRASAVGRGEDHLDLDYPVWPISLLARVLAPLRDAFVESVLDECPVADYLRIMSAAQATLPAVGAHRQRLWAARQIASGQSPDESPVPANMNVGG